MRSGNNLAEKAESGWHNAAALQTMTDMTLLFKVSISALSKSVNY